MEGYPKYKNSMGNKDLKSRKKSEERERQDFGKCRGNLRSRHFKDNDKGAQGFEMIWSCKEAALGQNRKESNIIWSGLRCGVLKWKREDLRNERNTAKATFPLLF